MRNILFLCVILVTVSLLNSNNTELPFNVHDVKEQISRYSTSANRQPRYTWNTEGYHFQNARSDEFLIDTNIVYVPARKLQWIPSIASNGTNYLVVWQDDEGRFGSIYGTRVDMNGTVLDKGGISIFAAPYVCAQPSVAFDGTNYLVVWSDNRDDNHDDIYGIRVNQSGVVIDTFDIAVSTSPAYYQQNPSVASDGTNYLVVWQEKPYSSANYKIYGCRVSATGEVIDTSGIPISEERCTNPSVVFDGTNYLVVWTYKNPYSTKTEAARVNQSGTVLDPVGITITWSSSDYAYPSAAFNGTNYLVVWSDTTSYVHGARVSKTGNVLDSPGFQIGDRTGGSPAISFDGTNYLVAWSISGPNDDIYASRVSPDGTVLDTISFPISTAEDDQRYPAVSFGGSRYLVVWRDNRFKYGYNHIYGSRVETSGTVVDTQGVIISTSANSQESPSVAFDGTNYFVVWQDSRSGTDLDIYGTRVSQAGMTLDYTGIEVSTAAHESQRYPSVAFGGNNYLVAWEDTRGQSYTNIYGARVNTSGTLLDPSGIAISDTIKGQHSPSIAFDGTNYLVVWEDERHDENDIYCSRISLSGSVLDLTGIPICVTGGHSPSVTFGATNYLVVWTSSGNVYGSRVTPAGGVLDPNGFEIINRTNYMSYTSVTYGNNNFFVVSREYIEAYNYDMCGARVAPSGLVLDTLGIVISTTDNSKANPYVSFDGTDFFVVWEEWIKGSNSMYGAKVDTSGHVENPFLIYSQNGDVANPDIASGSGGQLFLTWSGWTPYINGNPANAMRIWGKLDPHSGIKEKPENSHVQNLKLQVYPNPCKQTVLIKLVHSLSNINASLVVYDVTGRCVKTFFKSELLYPESQLITWDGKDNSGAQVPSGVYFLQFETDNNKVTAKLLMIK